MREWANCFTASTSSSVMDRTRIAIEHLHLRMCSYSTSELSDEPLKLTMEMSGQEQGPAGPRLGPAVLVDLNPPGRLGGRWVDYLMVK